MTVYAICITALSGLLAGILCSRLKSRKKPDEKKAHTRRESEISNQEYLNFLKYDGTEQE